MRSLWKGSISFGLVNIPVAVYPATSEERVAFKQLRKKDLSPIRYKKVAEADGQEVPADEIVKGFEYERNKWVVLEDKDFEDVQIASTHTIEITDFIDVAAMHPKYFHKPYFLEADKGGEKAYSLLHRALSDTGQIGIAKVAIRSREYLAALKPDGLFLMLDLMHFASEFLQPEGLKPAVGELINAKELAMAKSLVETMANDWQPEKYTDQYQTALRDVIERKIKHLPPDAKPVQPRTAFDMPDILAVLQQSIEQGEDKRKKAGARGTRPKPTPGLKQKRPSISVQSKN